MSTHSSSSRRSARKMVSFDKLIVTEIDCEYSQDEIYAYWHQGHEFDRMRKRDRTIAKRVSQGNCDRNYCTHGLIDDKYRRARRTRVREAILAVLLEQETQREQIVEDCETIGELYYDKCNADLLMGLERAITLENQLREDGILPTKQTPPATNNSKVPKTKVSEKSPAGLVISPKKSRISMMLNATERNSLCLPRQL